MLGGVFDKEVEGFAGDSDGILFRRVLPGVYFFEYLRVPIIISFFILIILLLFNHSMSSSWPLLIIIKEPLIWYKSPRI